MADLFEDSPQRRGGLRRAANLEPARRSEIGRLGAERRWKDNDLPISTDEGTLRLGDAQLPCAVLADGRRVLTQSGVMKALGRARQAKGRQYYDGDVNLPAFLTAKNLKPFIPNELYVTSSQIEFRRKEGGTKAFGYPAELLPKVCRVFIAADEAGALAPNQKHIAAQAKRLLEGLENVAIVALIDEATGYQEKRAKDELQKILAAYISPSLLPWSERFPVDFFKEMFRVWGWPWPAYETYKGPLGPRYAGKLIKQLILENLPPGVLQELEKRNPPNEKWQRRTRMGQLLTSGIGHPHVDKLVANMTMLFRLSDNQQQFWKHYSKAFKKPSPQDELFHDVA